MVSASDQLVTGDGRTITVEEVARLYRDGLNTATPSSGKIKRLSENSFSITCAYNTLDSDILETVKTSKIYSVKVQNSDIASAELVADNLAADISSVTSNNGRFLAKLKTPSNGGKDGAKKQALEIWDRNKHLKTIEVSELEAHGPINVDLMFGNFQWCPFGEQDRLLYICQPKQPKNVNFFKPEKAKPDGAASQSVERGLEYQHVESWGEGLTEISHTIIGILDVANNFQVITIDMEGFSLAESRWMDGGNKIVSVAYNEEPRRLGLIYCNNRASRIVVHDITQSPPSREEIAEEGRCYHAVRVDHSGQRFAYLSNKVHGPHYHAVHLNLYDIRQNQSRLLLDRLDANRDLFIDSLPHNCFSSNDDLIVFENSQQLPAGTYALRLSDLRLEQLGSNLSIYDYRHDILLFSKSSVNETPSLGVALVDPGQPNRLNFRYLEEGVRNPEVNFEIDHSLNSLYIWPGSEQATHDLPTIVLVHGGPHAAFPARYMPALIFYARLGLKSILINYRGSAGLTEEYLQSLCGEIGNLDVADCLRILRHYVDNKHVNRDKLIIHGGSHGGFISCHLSCQDEFKFTCAIIRNPVVSLPSMFETADIPDWIYTEVLNHRHVDFTWKPSEADLVKMYRRSADHTKAHVPTLMLLGDKDQRVKMFQGMRWYELLKARGIDTKCKVYPDKHDLSKPEVQADWQIEAVVWMLSHLPK